MLPKSVSFVNSKFFVCSTSTKKEGIQFFQRSQFLSCLDVYMYVLKSKLIFHEVCILGLLSSYLVFFSFRLRCASMPIDLRCHSLMNNSGLPVSSTLFVIVLLDV